MPEAIIDNKYPDLGLPDLFYMFLDENGAHKVSTPKRPHQHERWHVLKHREGIAEMIFGLGGKELIVTIDHLPRGAIRLVGTGEALRYISRESHLFDYPTEPNK